MNKAHFEYLLRIADNCLIHGQRIAEWCGHGPILEEDIALSNTSLDYIGQATNVYKHAAELEGNGRDEDQLAFLRDAPEFKNVLLLELPNGDYSYTIAKQFLFSSWYYFFLEKLTQSSDDFLKAFAEKSIKEVKYHVQHSRDWVLRMGDGTEESHQRISKSIQELWEYTPELFEMDDVDQQMLSEGKGVDLKALHASWYQLVTDTLKEATIGIPADGWGHSGGKKGRHSEYLGFILAEMQFLQRAYPNAKW